MATHYTYFERNTAGGVTPLLKKGLKNGEFWSTADVWQGVGGDIIVGDPNDFEPDEVGQYTYSGKVVDYLH